MATAKPTFGQQCAELCKLAAAEHRKAGKPLQWQEVGDIIDAVDTDRKVARKARAPQSEEEWMAALKADPFLKGVDFGKELAACQYWCRTHKAKCSRRRVENWLKKAAMDATVANPGGPATHAPLPDPGPLGWLKWARENLPGWKRFADEVAGYPLPLWHKLRSDEQAAIRRQMKGTAP